jgi:CheY-specific phosphatase CheX
LQQSEVTGLIGFAGAMGGYVSIHCSHSQAAEFTARLLGADPDEQRSTDEVRDAIGELINIIAGTVKRELGSEDPIEIALPTVVMGAKPDMRVRAQTGVVVPFEDPSGIFHVELVMS